MAVVAFAMDSNRRDRDNEYHERKRKSIIRRLEKEKEAEANLLWQKRITRSVDRNITTASKEKKKTEHNQVMENLNALFEMSTIPDTGGNITINSKGFTLKEPPHTYYAYMCVKHQLPRGHGGFHDTNFQLPIYTKEETPTIMPYLLNDNDPGTLPPAALVSTIKTIIDCWIPICTALLKHEYWNYNINVDAVLTKLEDTFDYNAKMTCFMMNRTDRVFHITSRTADGKSLFTLRKDKETVTSQYDIPAQLPILITKIEQHMEIRLNPWSAQYTTQINRITRLLDEAQTPLQI
jgi:hypothetical protein